MNTLYITDLDGTLLDSNQRLSDYTIETINKLIVDGMCFSYATARSLSSASIVTKGLIPDIPVIVYNGTFIMNARTGEILSSLDFSQDEIDQVSSFLTSHSIYPLVYSFIEGKERVSWIKGTENEGILRYLNLRKGDKRMREVSKISDLYKGNAFYFTCIGEKEDLIKVYDKFVNNPKYTCIIQQELYREEYWCEIMPHDATKGNAIKRLKNLLQCDRVISFGDAINDIPMFRVSDECYAVSNGAPELKEIATGIIRSNDENGVAQFLFCRQNNK